MRSLNGAARAVLLLAAVFAGCGGDDPAGPGGPAPPQTSSFVHSVGSTEIDIAYGLAALSNGTRVITGPFSGTGQLHALSDRDQLAVSDSLVGVAGFDIFVTGYDAKGAREFERSFGGANDDVGTGVADLGGGEFVVTGQFQGTVPFGAASLTSAGDSDIFLVGFDASADPMWAVRAGGTEADNAWKVIVDGGGDLYVTGGFSGSASFGSTTLTGNGQSDAFLAKYDRTGGLIWAKGWGSTGFDVTFGVCTDANDNVYVSGVFNGTVDFGGGPVTSAGAGDAFVAKFASNGAFQWVRTGGGSAGDEGLGLACDASGNLVLGTDFTGTATFGTTNLTSAGNFDMAIVSYNSSGDLRWVRRYGGTNWDAAVGVVMSGTRTFVTGFYEGMVTFGGTTLTSAGLRDAFVAELDGIGGVVWVESGGGTFIDVGWSIARADGRVIVSGGFTGSALFGSSSIDGEGEVDAFIYQR